MAEPQKPPDAKGKPNRSFQEKLEAAVAGFQQQVADVVISLRPEKRGSVALGAKQAAPPPSLRIYFNELAWSRSMVAWLIVGIVVQVCLMAVMAAGYLSASARPAGFVKGSPSVRDRSAAFMASAYETRADTLDLYIHTTLALLQNSDSRGQRSIDLLMGVVKPSILDNAKRMQNDRTLSMQTNVISQALFIESIPPENIVINEDARRISVYVKGYFLIGMMVTKSGARASIVKYRARVILEPNIPTRLNPLHFYMVDLQERIGPKAPDWDKEQALKK